MNVNNNEKTIKIKSYYPSNINPYNKIRNSHKEGTTTVETLTDEQYKKNVAKHLSAEAINRHMKEVKASRKASNPSRPIVSLLKKIFNKS